jgi:hypothetical protein
MAGHERSSSRSEQKNGAMAIHLSTVSNPGVIMGAPPSPVIGLHVIPAGPRYLFPDVPGQKVRRRYAIIGTARDCDLRLRDPAISRQHCAIVRTKGRVYVYDLDSTNGLWVAGCRVRACKLQPGAVFTIGNNSIAAIGPEDIGRDIVIAASTLPEFLHKAMDAYGSIKAASKGIGVPYSTLRGWLKRK